MLHKKHNQSVLSALNNINVTVVKKDTMALGVNKSGYLIPLNLSVWKQISFAADAQFYAKFSEQQYSVPTLYILVDNDEVIQGATSGIKHRNIIYRVDFLVQ
jgi:hypothetical protein